MSSDPHVSADLPESSSTTTPATGAAPNRSAAKRVSKVKSEVRFTRAAALWSALIFGFVILIVLLVFIAQNTESTAFAFLGWHWSLPLGVAILLAAVCGGLITTLVGTARIAQLRRAAKKNLKLTPQ